MNNFWQHFGNQDFVKAAQELAKMSEQEQAELLASFYQHGGDTQKPFLISVLERELQDDTSFDDFHATWLPEDELTNPQESGGRTYQNFWPVPTRVLQGVNMHDEKDVVSVSIAWLKKENFDTFVADLQAKESKSKRGQKLADMTSKKRKKLYRVVKDLNVGTEF